MFLLEVTSNKGSNKGQNSFSPIKGGGGGGGGFGKHDFEIMVDPKGIPSEPTFWLGL